MGHLSQKGNLDIRWEAGVVDMAGCDPALMHAAPGNLSLDMAVVFRPRAKRPFLA